MAAGKQNAADLREHAGSARRRLDEPACGPDRLYAAMAAAADFYRDQLAALPEQTGPRAYLTSRAGGPAAVEAWQAGYAPAGWTGLTDLLHAGGFTDDELLAAGVGLRTRRGTVVDRFRNRLMLPVHDETGRPVGFVGRAAPGAAADVPRYLNSPEGPLYHKGQLLLGLHPGRELLQAGAVPVIVEGAFDAMAVTGSADGHYVGVAPSGTALTVAQVDALARAAPLADRGVVVAFDGDPAGQRAAAAAFPHLAARGAWPGHALLPAGADPASLPGAGLRDAIEAAGGRPLAHLNHRTGRLAAPRRAGSSRWPGSRRPRRRPCAGTSTPARPYRGAAASGGRTHQHDRRPAAARHRTRTGE